MPLFLFLHLAFQDTHGPAEVEVVPAYRDRYNATLDEGLANGTAALNRSRPRVWTSDRRQAKYFSTLRMRVRMRTSPDATTDTLTHVLT